jgi:rare lipoprotein A
MMLNLKTSAAAGIAALILGAGMTGEAAARSQCGTASWYQMGHTTASGERYNPDGMTAAHRTLPFGTMVTVKNMRNGRSVRVRINDRGPFIKGRIIDVSRGAARQLGLIGSGTAKVAVSTGGIGGGRC